ncbi:hypothetical protein [Burkholderia sp. USMB20]|uniref:hypothetical protein n=1 Tax=Burkholderia sp. USMB20 TaxID=1571773 RepID=UPI0010923AB0|nr:hypothetical protein [Burkholderia sp. USMB20]TGN94293.1 hypothetical protein PL79_025960 [Burkholderia sp. USMB20]
MVNLLECAAVWKEHVSLRSQLSMHGACQALLMRAGNTSNLMKTNEIQSARRHFTGFAGQDRSTAVSGSSRRFPRLLFYPGQQERDVTLAIRVEGIDGQPQRVSACAGKPSTRCCADGRRQPALAQRSSRGTSDH